LISTLPLSGSTSITINLGSTFTDPGVTSIEDITNINLPVYITFIGSGSNNYINNNILISGSSTLITSTSLLTSGSNTITYSSTDTTGNINYINRIINIIIVLYSINNFYFIRFKN
jgi:hypothetical protein